MTDRSAQAGSLQEQEVSPETHAYLGELDELDKLVKRDSAAYESWHRRYKLLHYLLGVPATLLAAIAGAAAFADQVPAWLVGGCAAAAAALTGVLTFIHADQQARFNREQAIALECLAGEIRIARIGMPKLSRGAAVAELQRLQKTYYGVRRRLQAL